MPSSTAARALADAVDATLATYLADGSVPGVSVAIADRSGPVLTRTAGFRDVAARVPVDADTLFEIGSIGKSYAAVIALQLADEGRLALDDPVDRHLRWFRIPRTGKRITIHHLLSHTAGITAGMEGTPEAVVQVWQLRHVRPGSAPGRHFHYSNVGYKAVGLLIEAIEGRPFPAVVQDRLLDPIGLAATSPAITHDLRPRMAIGYGPARDDRPFQPGDALAPVTWFETATADGGVAATAADLAAWMRWLMSGPDGYADRMIDVTGAPDSEGYGYAMWSFEVDGRTYRAHNGGMVGFLAGMQWDVEAGLGAVVLQNGMGRAPGALARLLTRQARAAREGRDPATELPEQGSWEALEAADDDGAEAARRKPITEPTADQAVRTGSWRSHDPWTPFFRVEARGADLWLTFFGAPDGADETQVLVPMAGGWYRLGEHRLGPERIRFDTVVDGRARRAVLSGWPWYRAD